MLALPPVRSSRVMAGAERRDSTRWFHPRPDGAARSVRTIIDFSGLEEAFRARFFEMTPTKEQRHTGRGLNRASWWGGQRLRLEFADLYAQVPSSECSQTASEGGS